jgi:sugar lactone lactonase YvrE
MRTRFISAVAAALALSAGATILFAQVPVTPTPPGQETPQMLALKPKAENVPDIPVQVVENFMKFPDPNARYLMGEGIGVARNSQGMIYVNTCSQQTRVLEFDPNGNFTREIGKDLLGHIWCHGVRVDPQDNIWSIDSGSNMMIRFNPAGRVTMLIGRRPEYPVSGLVSAPDAIEDSADAPRYIFNRPTDVAFDAQGNIFVADGYRNARVVKYDKDGRFVAQAGSRGSGPGQMTTPHAIAVGPNGDVYVGSRSDQRIVVFDNDLNYKTVYDNVGAPWSLCVGPASDPHLWTSNSNPDSQNTPLHEVTGQIFKMTLDGQVVGKFGVPGKHQGQFSTVHGIDCSVENEILTTEITQWRMQKFLLGPKASQGGN